jgi:hypothetical protein
MNYKKKEDRTDSYILQLRLKTEEYQVLELNKRLNISRQIYNACISELLTRLQAMRNSKAYRKARSMPKSKEKTELFKKLCVDYKFTETSIHDYVAPMNKHFKGILYSHVVQKIATRAFQTVKKKAFGKAKKVHFVKFGNYDSVENKAKDSGISFKDNIITWCGISIPVIIRKSDVFAQEAIQSSRIKYIRIKRDFIKGEYVFYAELILEGDPPPKRNKDGSFRHIPGNSTVGIDIGTSSVAVVSDNNVFLKALAPQVKDHEKEIQRLQRKLDRSRRKTNPNNYDDNGKVKAGIKLVWIRSKKYLSTLYKIKDLKRKQRLTRKHSHNKIINEIIRQGTDVNIEKMNFKSLQKKTKVAKKHETGKKKGRFRSRKRFGKSIGIHAPGLFVSQLRQKLKSIGKTLREIPPANIKASQYNHISDSYKKKKLSERDTKIGEDTIQRDLYSAFILQCLEKIIVPDIPKDKEVAAEPEKTAKEVKPKKTDKPDKINKQQMHEKYSNFKRLHDIEINRIKNSNDKICSSFGFKKAS